MESYVNFILRGAITLAAGVDDHIIETTGNVIYSTIRGGIYDGNKANQGAGNWDGFNFASRWSRGRILDVEITSCKRHGIYMSEPNSGHIRGCHVTTNDGDGIHIYKEHNSCYYNHCFSNGGSGINLSDATNTHTRLIGNSCSSNTEYGIYVQGTEHTVIGNTCSFNSITGIFLACTDSIFNGNRSNNNTWYGFSIGGSRNILTGNEIKDNGDGARDGILINNKNHCMIVGNIITDSDGSHTVTGIEIAGGSTDNVIEANLINNMVTNVITDAGTTTRFRNNIGWESHREGVTGAVADGGTFAHGLHTTPTGCVVTGTVTGDLITVSALGAANVTVAIKDEGGGAGSAQALYWYAWV